MGCSAYIDDGYTRTDTFPATRRHPAVTVTYRPVTARERRIMIAKNTQYSQEGEPAGEKVVDYTINLVAKHLTEWSVTNSKGEPVAISAKTYGEIEPNLFEEIQKAVLGFDDGQIDPIAAQRESDNAKNSPPGSVSL